MKNQITETVDAILDDIDQHKVCGLCAWAEIACRLSRQLQTFKAEEKHYNKHFLDNCMEERARIILRTRYLLEHFQEAVDESVESVLAGFVTPETPGPLYSSEFSELFRRAKLLMFNAHDLAQEQSYLDQRVNTVRELLWACKSARRSVRGHIDGNELAKGWIPSLEECREVAQKLRSQFRANIDAAEELKLEIDRKLEAFEGQYKMWGTSQTEVCQGANQELQHIIDSIAKTQEAYKTPSPALGILQTCRNRLYSPLL